MLDYKLSKSAIRSLTKIERSDPKTALRIDEKITQLRTQELKGIPLKGASNYSRVRVGKYRIISTIRDDILLVFIIEKRETVYDTFDHFLKSR